MNDSISLVKSQFPIFLTGPTGTVAGPTGAAGFIVYDIVAVGPTGTSPLTILSPSQTVSLKEVGPIIVQNQPITNLLIANTTLNTSNSQYIMTIGRSSVSGGYPNLATNLVDGQVNVTNMISNSHYLSANYHTNISGSHSLTLSGQCVDTISNAGTYYYNIYIAYLGSESDTFLSDANAMLSVLNVTPNQ